MTPKRINILIYTGPGASPPSIRHATHTLRRLLGPHYAVGTLTPAQLLAEPWTASCACLVFPGGADAQYCRVLDGEGNRRIAQYVRLGGTYLGFCAGGYFGCARCEFEVGKRGMEVVGGRELGFFPGVCRGLAFGGFGYGSERGARAVGLVGGDGVGFRVYYNGGGVFVDAGKLEDRGVEVLARFGEELAVDGGEGGAAVVYCKVGEGAAILTAPHPEFSGFNLNREEPSNPDYSTLVDALREDDEKRTAFIKACLTKLGLEVSQEDSAVPSLSRLHLSSAQPDEIAELVQSWREAGILTVEDDEEYIKGENDTFHLENVDRWSVSGLLAAVKDVVPDAVNNAATASASSSSTASKSYDPTNPLTNSSSTLDSKSPPLHLVAHTTSLPDPKETPHFNHHAYYAAHAHYLAFHPGLAGTYGAHLLYGEVVTSTSTLLEKNPALLSYLPLGTTATATTQTSGRGRGSNVWVSPPGSLMFSTVLKHSLSLNRTAPVVFVQYLAAMAVVAGIQGYGRGTRQSAAYASLPIKLKWPNDIYALDPASTSTASDDEEGERKRYTKLGGILVNSSYAGGDYTLILGVGLNALNASSPTTALSSLTSLPFTLEALQACILTHFESLYTRFCRTGFDAWFERLYYRDWLHMDQIVVLEAEGGVRARVRGITRDWGLLVAEECEGGRRVALQGDANSFDFWRGLVRRKI